MHIPFEDKDANALVFKFITDFKPDYVDVLGDLIDFWQISKFRKNPNRRADIQKDIDLASNYLSELRDIAPKSEITLHYGNHLSRLRKYIWDRAKELISIRSLDLNWLLGCEELRIKTIEEEEGYDIRGKLVLAHGTIASKDSGLTARRNLAKYGLSVLCGHTHRLGSVYKTDLRGIVGSWENGCLCSLKLAQNWGVELANWQLGFSIVFFKNDKFLVQQIPIIKSSLMIGEKIYKL